MSTPKGMVAKRHQNSTNTSVTVVEYVQAPVGKATGTVVNCSVCGKPFTIHGMVPDSPLCLECKEKANRKRQEELNSRTWVTCVNCGKLFYITKSKGALLKSQGRPLYDKCYACQERKDDKCPTTEKE